jgi:hypothetical protein
MKLRKLRIAFSVACGIFGLLLIVLWMRSYQYYAGLSCPLSRNRYAFADIQFGRAYLYSSEQRKPQPRFTTRKINSPKEKTIAWLRQRETAGGFGAFEDLGLKVLIVPLWFFLALTGLVATLPWFRWSRRFSLRAVFIGITLVAIALALLNFFRARPNGPPIDVGDFADPN